MSSHNSTCDLDYVDATAKRPRKNHSRFAPGSAAPKISKGSRVTPSRGRRLELEAAEEAGLRYVSENQPGYTRKAKGDEFEYFDTEGKAVGDEQRLLRIKRLAIPPAWAEVWISPTANGHVQATGRDARNRKQYIYHERWREMRDENKYERIVSFGKALPKIRRRVSKDLSLPGLPRNKVVAAIVQLLEDSFIRVGNEEYARENKSFGLTTMKDRHVEVKGAKLRFRFRGKSGRDHEVDVTDRHIAKIISKLQDLPGQDLFQYVDDDGEIRDVTSQDVNEYLREITGEDVTANSWAPGVRPDVASSTKICSKPRSQASRAVDSTPKFVAMPPKTSVRTPRRRNCSSSAVP